MELRDNWVRTFIPDALRKQESWAGQPPLGFLRLLRTLSKEDVLHETSRSDRSSMNVRTFRGLYFLLVEWFVRASLVTLLYVARKSRGIQKNGRGGQENIAIRSGPWQNQMHIL